MGLSHPNRAGFAQKLHFRSTPRMPGHDSLLAEILAVAPDLELFEKLFESFDDAVFCVKNRRRQYVAVNSAFVRRVGLRTKAALLGQTARSVFPPLLAAAYEQQDDAVFSTGQEIHDRLEMITNSSGQTGWYLAQKVPIRAASGTIVALVGVSRDLRAPTESDPRLAVIGGIITRIQRDYVEPLRMEDLARNARMSSSQLERRMRAVLHLSPRQFLTKTRIEAAAHALRDTTNKLGAIASECGFYDQAMFCRQFRNATGLTPSQYRAASIDSRA